MTRSSLSSDPKVREQMFPLENKFKKLLPRHLGTTLVPSKADGRVSTVHMTDIQCGVTGHKSDPAWTEEKQRHAEQGDQQHL